MKERGHNWQARRAALLCEVCTHVDQLRSSGMTLKDAMRRASRKFKGRSLGEGKRLRLGVDTVRRLFDGWRKCPGTKTFALRYVPGKAKKAFAGEVRAILETALARRETLCSAFETLGGESALGFSKATLYRKAEKGKVAAIRRAQALAKELARMEVVVLAGEKGGGRGKVRGQIGAGGGVGRAGRCGSAGGDSGKTGAEVDIDRAARTGGTGGVGSVGCGARPSEDGRVK